MKNYKYRYTNATFVLTPDEHETVLKSVKSGQSSVFIRGGKLMINMSLVANISETDELTTTEDESVLKLAPTRMVWNSAGRKLGMARLSAWAKGQEWFTKHQNEKHS